MNIYNSNSKRIKSTKEYRLDSNYSANKEKFEYFRKYDYRKINKNDIYMSIIKNNNNCDDNNNIGIFAGEKLVEGIYGKNEETANTIEQSKKINFAQKKNTDDDKNKINKVRVTSSIKERVIKDEDSKNQNCEILGNSIAFNGDKTKTDYIYNNIVKIRKRFDNINKISKIVNNDLYINKVNNGRVQQNENLVNFAKINKNIQKINKYIDNKIKKNINNQTSNNNKANDIIDNNKYFSLKNNYYNKNDMISKGIKAKGISVKNIKNEKKNNNISNNKQLKPGEIKINKLDIEEKNLLETKINNLNQKITNLENENQIMNEKANLFEKEMKNKSQLVRNLNETIEKVNKELKEKNLLLNEKEKKIKDYNNIIKNKEMIIYEFDEEKKKNGLLLSEKDNKIKELELELSLLKKREKDNELLSNEKNNKIKKFEEKLSLFKTKEIANEKLLDEKNNKIKELELELFQLKSREKENGLLLKEKNNKIKEFELELSSLKAKNNENILLLNEKNNKIKQIEKELSLLKTKDKENILLINEKTNKIKEIGEELSQKKENELKLIEQINELRKSLNNKDNELLKLKKKYSDELEKKNDKEKNVQLSEVKYSNNLSGGGMILDICDGRQSKQINYDNNELKIESKRTSVKINKIYGFTAGGNNCYLNSSLQLLTRINELKYEVFNFNKKEINRNSDTKGKLIDEFINILNKIENSKNDSFVINPNNLKLIMGNIDDKYFRNSQEDASEFINNFINGLLEETINKENGKKVNQLIMKKKTDQEAYDKFHKRFFIKKGYSFVKNIFYGIMQTINYCNICKKEFLNSFNAYCMIKLPIYNLALRKKKSNIELKEILDEYRTEKKMEMNCNICKNKNISTKTLLITFPKFLLVVFMRNADGQHLSNNIIYDDKLSIMSDYDNKIYKYDLECVIEHSGGIGFGHYTALCPKDSNNNKWYRFNESYCDRENYGYQSKNATVLLYKLDNNFL